MKNSVTWILVADHQRASVYEKHGPAGELRFVEGLDAAARLPAGRDILSDRPGRSFESNGGGMRHAVEPRSDPREQEAMRFLHGVVEAVDEAAGRNSFDRLLLVAPPRALGELRKLLPQRLADKVTGELAEDLTKHTTDSLAAHLAQHLNV